MTRDIKFKWCWLIAIIIGLVSLNLFVIDCWRFDNIQTSIATITRIDQNGNVYDITTSAKRLTGKPFTYTVSYGEVKPLNINDKVLVRSEHKEIFPTFSQKVTKPVVQHLKASTPYILILLNVVLLVNELLLRYSITPVKDRYMGLYGTNNPYLEALNSCCMMITTISIITSVILISSFK